MLALDAYFHCLLALDAYFHCFQVSKMFSSDFMPYIYIYIYIYLFCH